MDEMNKCKHGRDRFKGAALQIREIYAHVTFLTLSYLICFFFHSFRRQTRRLNRSSSTMAQTMRFDSRKSFWGERGSLKTTKLV
jgi:hypothetical protein